LLDDYHFVHLLCQLERAGLPQCLNAGPVSDGLDILDQASLKLPAYAIELCINGVFLAKLQQFSNIM
jgi:hypothetical protein